MASRVTIDFSSAAAAAGIRWELSSLGWLTAEWAVHGRRVTATVETSPDRQPLLVARALEVVTASFPHAVSVDGNRLPAGGFEALRGWLAAHCGGDFAIFLYGDGDSVLRCVFCFRSADDALRFGHRGRD